MLGALIGDIAGSRFEFNNLKSKEFTLFTRRCFPTDDSNMTLWVILLILLSAGLIGFNLMYRKRKSTEKKQDK